MTTLLAYSAEAAVLAAKAGRQGFGGLSALGTAGRNPAEARIFVFIHG